MVSGQILRPPQWVIFFKSSESVFRVFFLLKASLNLKLLLSKVARLARLSVDLAMSGGREAISETGRKRPAIMS